MTKNWPIKSSQKISTISLLFLKIRKIKIVLIILGHIINPIFLSNKSKRLIILTNSPISDAQFLDLKVGICLQHKIISNNLRNKVIFSQYPNLIILKTIYYKIIKRF